MIHDMDISKWPNATFAKWSALIDQTSAMEWNREVVNPTKVTLYSAELAASALLGTNTARHDKS
jgi:hypothetical protein